MHTVPDKSLNGERSSFDLAQEMEEGYRSETESPSLEPEWASFEVEGLTPIQPE